MEFQRQLISRSSSPSKAYRDLIGKPIMQHITANYITAMFAALEAGDAKNFKEHKQEFMRFGRKTPIIHDIIELCSRIENYKSEQNNSEVTDLLAKRINAVHTDDLMAAADYTKKLKGLIGKDDDAEVKKLLDSLNFSS